MVVTDSQSQSQLTRGCHAMLLQDRNTPLSRYDQINWCIMAAPIKNAPMKRETFQGHTRMASGELIGDHIEKANQATNLITTEKVHPGDENSFIHDYATLRIWIWDLGTSDCEFKSWTVD